MPFFNFIFLILPILISVAFLTLIERKFLGIVGFRPGPNKVRISGIFQPIGDAFKLSNKSNNSLLNFSFYFYYLRGFFIITFSLCLWSIFFREPCPISLKFGLIFFILILGLNSFNSIFSGWRTLRKYTLIGRMRTVAQLISYEAALYICLIFLIFSYCCFNTFSIIFFPFSFFSLLIPIVFYFWLPSILAELNRTPFDFSEGESELVRGFNTDFGSSLFTLIFLREYSNILFFSLFSYFLFFFFRINFFFLFFLYIIWIRSVLPRYRFDKLMLLCWKFFVPFLTMFFLFFVIHI